MATKEYWAKRKEEALKQQIEELKEIVLQTTPDDKLINISLFGKTKFPKDKTYKIYSVEVVEDNLNYYLQLPKNFPPIKEEKIKVRICE